MTARRLLLGISGASGAINGVRLPQLLKGAGIETHLIVSRAARMTLSCETELPIDEVETLVDVTYPEQALGAACSSGSFKTLDMVVAPCSRKTMAQIASGFTSNLVSRAADVCLKKRRRLVLMLRETPLHLGHFHSMAAVTEAGAIVYLPVPAFYALPQSIEEMIDHTLGRVLDLFDIDLGTVRLWTGKAAKAPKAPESGD